MDPIATCLAVGVHFNGASNVPDITESRSSCFQIKCSPAVTVEVIFYKYLDHCPQCCDDCQRVLAEALRVVLKTSESRRKSCEITCLGEHLSLCFWSGKRKNKLEVRESGGKVNASWTSLSRWESFKKSVNPKDVAVGTLLVGAAIFKIIMFT
jgi:hypothetical protein